MATKARSDNKTKEKILDAAEKAFSKKGFHGTTVRDIFEIAELNSGLMAYYFESKNDLFAQVINRKMDAVTHLYRQAANKLMERCGGSPSPEQVCFLHIDFFFGHAFDPDSTYSDYVVLLTHASSVYEEELVGDLMAGFMPVIELTIDLLKHALPFASEAALERDYFYLETSVITVLVNREFRTVRLHDENGNLDMHDVARDMARFFGRAMALHELEAS